jgi:hypothetical protein
MNAFWLRYLQKKELISIELIVKLIALKYMPRENHLEFKSREEMLSLLKEIGSNLSNQCPVNGSLEIVDGIMVPSAATIPLEDGTSMITFNVESLVNELTQYLETNKIDKRRGIDLIYSVVLHEIWHSVQFKFLFEKGGLGLLKQVLNAESKYQYGESPLERGAYSYGNSFGKNKQNLNELLAS